MKTGSRIEALRDIVYTLSEEERWSALVELLEDWPEPELQELAIPYLRETLRGDTSPRRAPSTWVRLSLGGFTFHPALVFAHSVEIKEVKLGTAGARALGPWPAHPAWLG